MFVANKSLGINTWRGLGGRRLIASSVVVSPVRFRGVFLFLCSKGLDTGHLTLVLRVKRIKSNKRRIIYCYPPPLPPDARYACLIQKKKYENEEKKERKKCDYSGTNGFVQYL